MSAMSPYFYSFGMCITRRGWNDHPNLTLMDVIAHDIAREEMGEPFDPSRHTLAAIKHNATGPFPFA